MGAGAASRVITRYSLEKDRVPELLRALEPRMVCLAEGESHI